MLAGVFSVYVEVADAVGPSKTQKQASSLPAFGYFNGFQVASETAVIIGFPAKRIGVPGVGQVDSGRVFGQASFPAGGVTPVAVQENALSLGSCQGPSTQGEEGNQQSFHRMIYSASVRGRSPYKGNESAWELDCLGVETFLWELYVCDENGAARTVSRGPTAARYSNQEHLMQKPLLFMEQMGALN